MPAPADLAGFDSLEVRRIRGSEIGICFQALSYNSVHAHHGVLHIGPRLTLEAQRVLEVERDDGRAGETQEKITKRADGDCVGNGLALLLG